MSSNKLKININYEDLLKFLQILYQMINLLLNVKFAKEIASIK